MYKKLQKYVMGRLPVWTSACLDVCMSGLLPVWSAVYTSVAKIKFNYTLKPQRRV